MKLKGKGQFKQFLGKLSKLGNAYSKYGGMAGLPYTGLVGNAATVAQQAGYAYMVAGDEFVKEVGSMRLAVKCDAEGI